MPTVVIDLFLVTTFNVFVCRNLHVNGMDELLLFLGSNPDEVMMMSCFQQLCPKHIWMMYTHTQHTR